MIRYKKLCLKKSAMAAERLTVGVFVHVSGQVRFVESLSSLSATYTITCSTYVDISCGLSYQQGVYSNIDIVVLISN